MRTSWPKMCRAVVSQKTWRRRMKAVKVQPGTLSMTIQPWEAEKKRSMTLGIPGMVMRESISTSLYTAAIRRPRSPVWSESGQASVSWLDSELEVTVDVMLGGATSEAPRAIRLQANSSPLCLLTATKTRAWCPLPSTAPSEYAASNRNASTALSIAATHLRASISDAARKTTFLYFFSSPPPLPSSSTSTSKTAASPAFSPSCSRTAAKRPTQSRAGGGSANRALRSRPERAGTCWYGRAV
mmetsp:Transcript_48517/g.118712  ORF Transcript_48517/g.118712 Transcript_48517/m.118712 type:complete len:242 (-) Transcript_48517:142-867(-)